MLDQLARLQEPQLIFLAGLCGLLLFSFTVLGVVVAVQFRKLRQKELELGFKDELLLRGYSVDETIRLVTSGRPGWSQGLIDVGDWVEIKFRPATRRLCEIARVAVRDGSRQARDLWIRAVPRLHELRSRSVPWVRAGVCRLSSGAAWLGSKADALFRNLATPQP
ncbi:MAG: hypothetical protein AB7U20_04210 [Planctomycetaceae bacterium]